MDWVLPTLAIILTLSGTLLAFILTNKYRNKTKDYLSNIEELNKQIDSVTQKSKNLSLIHI